MIKAGNGLYHVIINLGERMKKIFIIIILIIIIIINTYFFINNNKYNNTNKNINNKDEKKTYSKYNIGDIIIIQEESWYVINESNESMDYVSIINLNYDKKIKDCFTKYDYLTEKKYLEGEYLNNLKINTKEVNGYRIRLITIDEYKNLVTLTKKPIDSIKYNYLVKYTYDWVKEINTLTMDDVDYHSDNETCASWYIQSSIKEVFGYKEGFIEIKPVINLKKEKI